MTVGQAIKEARLAKGMTQTELGNILGYSAMAISHFEKGTREIPAYRIPEFQKVLGIVSRRPKYNSAKRGGISNQELSLKAFDKYVSAKYQNNPNQP